MNKIVSVHPIFPPRKMFLLVVFIYYVCYRILSSAFLFKAQCLNKETSNHTTPAGIPFQRTSHISRVPNQNGASLLYIMLEIYHSGWEPSIYKYKHTKQGVDMEGKGRGNQQTAQSLRKLESDAFTSYLQYQVWKKLTEILQKKKTNDWTSLFQSTRSRDATGLLKK